MSRIGNKPVIVPDGVTIELAAQAMTAKGKLGELSMAVVDQVEFSHADNQIVVT
ncbi:MAG: 50S ribosomal protein L6, partial [Rhodospirillaceae bacterium]|nr:50S ribosomal protein L6 [Rhodospirillaceae bacterium]